MGEEGRGAEGSIWRLHHSSKAIPCYGSILLKVNLTNDFWREKSRPYLKLNSMRNFWRSSLGKGQLVRSNIGAMLLWPIS